MGQTRTNRRRRVQAKNGNTHLAVHGDPPRRIYHVHSEGFYARKRMSAIQKERDIARRKGEKKAKEGKKS